MSKVYGKLTVYFEDPFWVGVFERLEDGKLSAAKLTFGAEPKDFEIYEVIQKNYYGLKFSPTVSVAVSEVKKNPKRIQREIKKQIRSSGIGTKSQQALKLQQEQKKQENHQKNSKQKQEKSERIYELKQQKKKRKHKGH